MISLQSKQTIEAKSVPGVTFTVRTLNKIQRAKRDLPIIAARQAISMLLLEWEPLSKIDFKDRTPEQIVRMGAIDAEFWGIKDRDIKPANIKAGVVSIEGLEIDGAPVTADSLLESAGADYDALIDEINDACESASGLTETQAKNSQSDTTSSGQVDSNPTPSNATPAGN